MKKAKPWIKVLGFIAGLVVILMVCDFVFAQTGYVRFIIHEEKKGGYDTIVVGASHCRGAIDPQRLDDKLGTNTLNLAIPGESVQDSYFLRIMTLRPLYLILIISIGIMSSLLHILLSLLYISSLLIRR